MKRDKNGRYHDEKGHYISVKKSTVNSIYKVDKNGKYHDEKGRYVSLKQVEKDREIKERPKYYKDKYGEAEYERPVKRGVRTWDTGPIIAQPGGRYAIVVKMKMKGIKPDGETFHTIIQASPRLTKESYKLIRADGFNRYNIRGIEIEPVVTIDRKDGTRVDEYGRPTGK